jgi:hypothetical protein
MANEGNYAQSLSDKEYRYFGSDRIFYSGVTPGSTTAYAFINFSGTNTGFGPANNVLNQRVTIVASGGNARAVDFMFRSGTNSGELWAGESFTMDGVNFSGVWVRSSEATAQARVWAW